MRQGHATGRVVDLLSDMIRIPSVCPEESEPGAPAGERALAEFVAGYLGSLGFAINWQFCTDNRPNLITSFGPALARKTVAFEFHLDTVGIQGMTIAPFNPVVHDGKLMGRGACDDKGPAAALLSALSADVLESLRARNIRLFVVGAMGEEKGNVGAAKLVQGGFRADQVVVLEPTELAIIHAHKGALWFEVEIRGRAAHGSTPEKGLNAICACADVIEYLLETTAASAAANHNPLLGKPTINIGTIRGGAAINIVPDRCVLEVDRRLLPEEDGAAIIEHLRSELNRMKMDGEIVDGLVRLQKVGQPFQTSSNSELVERLAEACRACGVETRLEGAPWYSDAGELSQVASEIVVFGPGSIHQAHTAEEYIELEELHQAVGILREFLLRL